MLIENNNMEDDFMLPDELKEEKSWHYTCTVGKTHKAQKVWNGKKLLGSVKQNQDLLLTYPELEEQYNGLNEKDKQFINGFSFFVKEQSPFAVIDLDIKDNTPAETVDCINEIVNYAKSETFVQRSKGGRGYHIFIKIDKKEKNLQSQGFEIFVKDKPIAMTGNIVSSMVNVHKCDAILNATVEAIKHQQELAVKKRVEERAQKIQDEIFNNDQTIHGRLLKSFGDTLDKTDLPYLEFTSNNKIASAQDPHIMNVKTIMTFAGITAKFNMHEKEVELYSDNESQQKLFDEARQIERNLALNVLSDHAKPVGIKSEKDFKKRVKRISDSNRFHPFGDFLQSNHPAKTKDNIIQEVMDCFKVKSEYKQIWPIFFTKWCLQAIDAAVSFNRPNQKRYALILSGPQKIGKSVCMKLLFNIGDGRPYVGEVADPINMDSIESSRQWYKLFVAEIAECDMLAKKEQAKIKKVLSQETDAIRELYSDYENVPRTTVFYGTSNEINLLSDSTGNSRWWPVEVERIDLPTLSKIDKKQFWLEMYQIYKVVMEDNEFGHLPWDLSSSEQKQLDDISAGFTSSNPVVEAWHQLVANYDISPDTIMDLPFEAKAPQNASTIATTLGYKLYGKQLTPLVEAIEATLGAGKKMRGMRKAWMMPVNFDEETIERRRMSWQDNF